MEVKPIPEGYHSITPYLVVRDTNGLIQFLKTVLYADMIELMKRPDGSVMHAEVRIGDSIVMMGDASETNPPMPAMLYVYLEDVNAAYQRAIAAGATSIQEPKNEFYGDRTAAFKDAYGNYWWVATRVEEVPPEEMQRRAEAEARAG